MAITEQHVKNKLVGKRITEAALLALPKDGNKYELVNGRLQALSATYLHERLIMSIAFLLGPLAVKFGEILGSNMGCLMANGNIRLPDLCFVTTARIPDAERQDAHFNGAPDLCIEVISPSEDRNDVIVRVVDYVESGAKQVWNVFTEAQRVVVYRSLDQVRTYEAHEELTAGDLIPGFSCSVASIFAA